MLRQLGHVVLEIIHFLCIGNVIGQMPKEMSKHFGAHVGTEHLEHILAREPKGAR